MRFIIFILLPILTFGQEVISLKKGVANEEIKEHIFTLTDKSNALTISDLINEKASLFEKSKVGIPNFGWGNRAGWVRFKIQVSESKLLLFHINSAIFDDLCFFVVDDKKIVQQYEHLSSKTSSENRPYMHRDFVFPLNLETKKVYTIYIKGKSFLNTNKFPMTIWNKRDFERNDQQTNFFWGIIIGIFILVGLVNFAIGFILKMRIFMLYGMYIVSIILIFLNLEGYLYEYLPTIILRNDIFDLTQYFTYGLFFWNLLFVIAFTKLSLASQPIYERILRILIIVFWLLLVHSIFSPIWLGFVSDNYIQVIGWLGRIFFLINIGILILTLLVSANKNSMSKIYLISIIPPTILYFLSQYFTYFLDIRIVQPYAYLIGFLFEIIILSIAIIFRVKEYLFSNLKIGTPLKVADKQVVETNVLQKKELLSKREIEILAAFAKGFTYQDISDALFISPHTVRTHIKNIYQKLEINSKAEAVKIAIESGWI
ncbi:7TM-DISM domain-containing protein [Emticicia aquatica]|nr:7TM-DISM domain-containing protein [Emticicia aquatica]